MTELVQLIMSDRITVEIPLVISEIAHNEFPDVISICRNTEQIDVQDIVQQHAVTFFVICSGVKDEYVLKKLRLWLDYEAA